MSATRLAFPLWAPYVFSLVMVLAAWVYYALRGQGEPARAPGGRIFRCAGCGKVYGENRDRPFAGCPRCGRFNEAVKR